MGIFDSAKSALSGNKAYRAHVDANKLVDAGKPREAREKYAAALKLYEDAVRNGMVAQNILQGYALLLLREGHFDEARDLLQRMSKMKTLSKDDWFQIRVYYSIYLWKTGQIDQAIETIGRAAAYKMNGNIYGTLGMYWVDKAKKTGDFQAALDFNQKAMDYDDEDAATLDNMGQLYEAMADAEADGAQAEAYRAQAIEYYRRAYHEKPRQITTLYYLARLFHRQGDDARARKLVSVRDTLYFSAICPITREMMEALAKEIG